MRRRERYTYKEGAWDVVMIAVWWEGLALYDAVDIAQQVMHNDENIRKHVGDSIFHGCVYADKCRLSARFFGCQ